MKKSNRAKIHIVEGVTCSGKTTLVRDILFVVGQNCGLLERPPEHKVGDDWIEHQKAVFDEYLTRFKLANGDLYADFSPFGCIPFTTAIMACYPPESEDKADRMNDLVRYMRESCDELCKQHMIYLHRYLTLDVESCWRRLSGRGRVGDNSWDYEFLEELIRHYDKFFSEAGLKILTNDRVIGLL